MSLFSRLLAIIVSLKYYFMLDYFTTTVDCPYFEYSISRTLLYLKQFIRSHGHIALDQSKKLSVSRISIFRIFAYVKQTFRSLEQVSLVISNFPQCFQNFPCNFSFQISIFQQPLAQLLQMSWQEWVKTLKSIFFVFFLFDQMFQLNFFITRIFNKTSLWR